MRHSIPLVVGLALALLAGPALADAGTVTLDSGQSADVAVFTLRAGQNVQYTWASGPGVELRISRSGTVLFSLTSQAGTGSWTAPSDGQYTFTFENTSPYMTGVSWTLAPQAVADSTPLLVAGVGGLAAAGVGVGFLMWRKRSAGSPRSPAPPR